ncbi:hypothetical protein B9T31_16680 [Acinetobacter sp. ANC 4558]|uniref:TetR/AcrR family transcriptional regulator n=1 Tax=Acinetobacter sp. ANC 4558 TaxID=1977876 RepID=UPI000A33208D|nr:TetR/AcrR family transcriptional regulator [Acinetobacter sp. ANC 4558]OTG79874.1 hypothetical protein B9T31_16680 [Acinetobacter sp. ANC 4558]
MNIRKIRSNTKDRIINVAFENFIVHGYEGTSLSAIAEEVGIRKASIYAHFSSKEALFLELLKKALEQECEYTILCFSAANDEEIPGEAYCHALKKRYVDSLSLRFLIRMTYVPPKNLIKPILLGHLTYLQGLINQIKAALVSLTLTREQVELYKDAYLGIIDSLCVELLYGENFYDRRLKAMLLLYRNTIQKHL